MPDIGIVGAGISGLHLALRLRQLGATATLYAEQGPEELAASRMPNMVARLEQTRARERTLGVAHWNDPDCLMYGARMSARGEPPIDFYGRLDKPCDCVDFRVYLPRLLTDFADRGGVVEYLTPDAESVARLAPRHDLLVVATGHRSVAELFPRDPARSPYAEPQRLCCAGFYTGVEPMPERGLHFQLCANAGEMFAARFLHADGPVHGLNIEAIPGGPFAHLPSLSYDDDPAGLIREVLAVLAEHAPGLRERINEREFDLVRPNDLLQGGITPTVRRGWTALPDNRYAIALGDAWVVNDPITGQGANLGSRCAFLLAEAIVAGPPYDEAFCRTVEMEMWELARPVTEWTNAFLRPPQPHALELLGQASEDPAIADAFINNFNDPAAIGAGSGPRCSRSSGVAWLSPSSDRRRRHLR